ncbi:MAG: hypothetical protein N2517_04780 [Ignavibacteria bacterium]|nr:hypothetical protein [Ignavibacteria bacterium]
MIQRSILKLVFIQILSIYISFGQSGSTFSEFKVKLSRYFSQDMIEDIEHQFPQKTRFSVWGWDVGDFSGDGNPDLGVSIKVHDERRKVTYVYLFADIDGFLEQVFMQPFEFVELPLEIGISIKNSKCYITQKKDSDFWTIRGYTFQNGVVYLVEEYVSRNLLGHSLETNISFEKNESIIKVNKTKKADLDFESKFFFVPSYPRNSEIFIGYPSETKVAQVDYAIKGSYYWKGEYDSNYKIKSSYDDDYIYLSFTIQDDIFIPKECEKCNGDFVSLWFNFEPTNSTLKRIFKQSGNKLVVKEVPEGNIYHLTINLGNFAKSYPNVESIYSLEPMDDEQVRSVSRIKVFSTQTNGNIILKVRIPYSLFGFERSPVDSDQPVYIGFTAIYHDLDNEFRPSEITQIASSIFDETNPATFGELIFITDFRKFSFAQNIFLSNILNSLEEFGF